MIGFISGKVREHLGKKVLVVTNNGVGYEINFDFKIIIGQSIEMYLHHHITDSDQSLWGFQNLEQKKMFELLKTVNKVGASKAYPLVSVVGIDNILLAINTQDASILTEAPGIGKKMAEQIILSLKDKINDIAPLSLNTQMSLESERSNEVSEANLALQSLGVDGPKTQRLVAELAQNANLGVEDIIKKVLQEI